MDEMRVLVKHHGRGSRWARFSIPVAVDSDGVVSVEGICIRPSADPLTGAATYRFVREASTNAHHAASAQNGAAPPRIHWVELELAIPDPDPDAAADYARERLAAAELTLRIREESTAKSRAEVAALREIIEAGGD